MAPLVSRKRGSPSNVRGRAARVVPCAHETRPPRRVSRRGRARRRQLHGRRRASRDGPAAAAPPTRPTVPSLAGLMEKEIHWGMSHADVTDAYNQLNGLFDREYAPLLAKLQPGVQQQQLEADRDNRKANFERSYAEFIAGSPTGYDVTAAAPRVHVRQRRGHPEALQGRQEPLLLLHQGPALEDLRRGPARGRRPARGDATRRP